jgi:hypothetical protein
MRFNSLLRSLGNASSVVKFPDTESKHVRLHDKHSQNKRDAGICGSGQKGPGQVPGSPLLGMWPCREKPLTDKPCQLNRSMQHPSNLLIR